MKIDADTIVKHADDVARILLLIGDVVGGRFGSIGHRAGPAIGVVSVAYQMLEASLHDKDLDIDERIRSLRSLLAGNDAAARAAITAKFDRPGKP